MDILLLGLGSGNYSAAQSVAAHPITVGQLLTALEGLDEEAPVVVYLGGYGVTHFTVTSAEQETIDTEED